MTTLYKFETSTCSTCKVMNPVFEKLAEEYEGKIDFKKVNVEEEENEHYIEEYSISNVPLFALVRDNEVLGKFHGPKAIGPFRDWIDELIK